MPLNPESALSIDSRSAGIEVVGTDQEGVRISCKLDEQDKAGEIKIAFSKTGNSHQIRIEGGPRNNVQIRIEVPQRTDLALNASAGEWKVSHVIGNKKIQLLAGEISVTPIPLEEYGFVDASVRIGAVNIPSKGVSKGGFFRSYTATAAPGKYRLEAHVTTGDITLE